MVWQIAFGVLLGGLLLWLAIGVIGAMLAHEGGRDVLAYCAIFPFGAAAGYLFWLAALADRSSNVWLLAVMVIGGGNLPAALAVERIREGRLKRARLAAQLERERLDARSTPLSPSPGRTGSNE